MSETRYKTRYEKMCIKYNIAIHPPTLLRQRLAASIKSGNIPHEKLIKIKEILDNA